MSHSPAFIKKASRLTVIPCDRVGVFHVGEGKSWHTLWLSAVGISVCDCIAAKHGEMCTHRLALYWDQHPKTTDKKESEN